MPALPSSSTAPGDYETIVLETGPEHVRTLRFDRPERLNAINDTLVTETLDALARVERDPSARVLVLSGSGRAFCAGADVSMMDENLEHEARESPWGSDEVRVKVRTRFQTLTSAVFHHPIPTIASVRGPAVGGGLDLVCACDLALAAENARFVVAYTHRGLFPDLGGFWLLPRLIGYRRAAELVFTGREVDAREAEIIGLVNRVVADDELEDATRTLAQDLASGPPIALRLGKLLMQRTAGSDFDTALEMGAMGTAITEGSADFRESVRAFLDGRPPQFEGR